MSAPSRVESDALCLCLSCLELAVVHPERAAPFLLELRHHPPAPLRQLGCVGRHRVQARLLTGILHTQRHNG